MEDYPDPSGPPESLKDSAFSGFCTIGIALLVAGAVFGLVGPLTTSSRTMGATRSTRLKWEQRRKEAAAAAAEVAERRADARAGEATRDE